jgi:DNA polymerase-4
MMKSENKGRTVTVKLKYSDFTQQTRSKTIEDYISTKEEFFPVIEELIYQKEIDKSVRLLGISISNLFREVEPPKKEEYSLQLKFDF